MPIVTAADHRFARTLHQMLASAERCALPAAHRISVVDLGMHERDRERIARRFPWCRIDRFDFTAGPPHLRELGNFAWKPFLIFDRVSRGDGPILWFDSATLFHGGIDAMIDGVSRDGIFSLAGQSSLGECFDPRTLAKLQPAPKTSLNRTARAACLASIRRGRWCATSSGDGAISQPIRHALRRRAPTGGVTSSIKRS